MIKSWIVYFSCFLAIGLNAQSYQLESINHNNLRDKQLMELYDSSISFNVQSNSIFPIPNINWRKINFKVLPFVLTQQYNSHHPFGWNDGPMIHAKGYQVLVRPGVHLNYGMFEAQFSPEFVYSTNGNYPSNNQFGISNNLQFNSIYSGQSFFKINLNKISIGVSSENLWWGPGINSSLLMGNNAPGFLHAFVKTNKPIKTPIGNFEFNLIGAKLLHNTSLPYENYHMQYRYFKEDWRYLNSYVVSWQPKWIKGLFIGMARSLQQYSTQAFNENKRSLINKYLPVLGLSIQKSNNLGDDSLNRDQLASFFLRWIFPKSRIEIYTEYGKNDYGLNYRDYLMSPSHSAAYTFGIRKILQPTDKKYIKLEFEITQMSQSPDYLVRDAGNWYEHGQVNQGYTNNNQIIGAGAGFGANVQTVSATWVKGEIRNGFLIQRLEHDPINKANKWNDISIGWMPQWTYKNMILGAKLQLIHSSNYAWEQGNNPLNLHSRLMIQYNFK